MPFFSDAEPFFVEALSPLRCFPHLEDSQIIAATLNPQQAHKKFIPPSLFPSLSPPIEKKYWCFLFTTFLCSALASDPLERANHFLAGLLCYNFFAPRLSYYLELGLRKEDSEAASPPNFHYTLVIPVHLILDPNHTWCAQPPAG